MLKDYILNTWSNNHKKSALAVLTLLVINAHNTWSGDLQRQLEAITGGSMVMDQHNLNRLLRRLEQLELIAARRTPNETGGAHRKTYRITHYGRHVLQEYCTSTLNYLNSPQFQEMIDRAVGSPATVDGRSCCGAEANRPRRNGG